MLNIAGYIWAALAAAVLFGAVVGGSTSTPGRSSRLDRALGALLAIALAGLIIASAQGLAAGRYAIWLDVGVQILAAYLLGCCLGWLLHRAARRPLGEDH